ncbi:MAG: cyclodeaminase/cyclohydrolase family protein [Candidatus Sericytochromatia bacterium]|nr:cyclodeaminase/cyclohydrolase family protein [Candidatus Sericytochromatia bacterium]
MESSVYVPLRQQPAADVLAELAEPQGPGVPGAGALLLATAASLLSRSARVTGRQPTYEAVSEEMERDAERARALADRLLVLVDQDAQAQLRLTQARMLPSATAEEAAIRMSCVDVALQGWARLSLATLEIGVELAMLVDRVLRYGHPACLGEARLAARLLGVVTEALQDAVEVPARAASETASEAWRTEAGELVGRILPVLAALPDVPVTA